MALIKYLVPILMFIVAMLYWYRCQQLRQLLDRAPS